MMVMTDEIKNVAIEQYGAKFTQGEMDYYKPAPNYPGVKSGRTPDRLKFDTEQKLVDFLGLYGYKIPENEELLFFHGWDFEEKREWTYVVVWVKENEITRGSW